MIITASESLQCPSRNKVLPNQGPAVESRGGATAVPIITATCRCHATW